jgi:hypothetical protein
MEKISWIDLVRNQEVLRGVNEEKNILQTIKRRKAKGIGNILHRNCCLKHLIEGNIEGRMEVKGRRRKQLLYDLKETRGYW